MIRVLNVISDTNIGGAGRSLLNYLGFRDRENFEAEVVLPRGSALLRPVQALGVPVHEINAMTDKSMDRRAVRPLREVIRAVRPNLVHTHGSLSGRIAARLERKSVVYTKHCAFPPHGLLASPPGRLANGALDGLLSDGVIAIGPSAREILTASGIPEKRIHVLLNGVAPIPAPTPEQRRAARAAFGFADGDFVLGILARVEEYKGHGILLDALKILLEEGRPVRLLVAGEGAYLDTLRERASALPEGAVAFAGFVKDVEKALWAMDVQVNASYESETSSLSLLEGMSMGLPAAVSDCGGNPSVISHGENGLVFPNRDSGGLARCAARLMDSREELERMGRRAEEIYRTRFTGEIFARNIENIYLDILKGAESWNKTHKDFV